MIRASDFPSVRAAVMESVARRDPDIFFDRRIVVAAPTNLDDLNSRRFLGNLHGANPHHYRALQGGIDCTHELPAITCRRLSYGPVGSLEFRDMLFRCNQGGALELGGVPPGAAFNIAITGHSSFMGPRDAGVQVPLGDGVRFVNGFQLRIDDLAVIRGFRHGVHLVNADDCRISARLDLNVCHLWVERQNNGNANYSSSLIIDSNWWGTPWRDGGEPARFIFQGSGTLHVRNTRFEGAADEAFYLNGGFAFHSAWYGIPHSAREGDVSFHIGPSACGRFIGCDLRGNGNEHVKTRVVVDEADQPASTWDGMHHDRRIYLIGCTPSFVAAWPPHPRVVVIR